MTFSQRIYRFLTKSAPTESLETVPTQTNEPNLNDEEAADAQAMEQPEPKPKCPPAQVSLKKPPADCPTVARLPPRSNPSQDSILCDDDDDDDDATPVFAQGLPRPPGVRERSTNLSSSSRNLERDEAAVPRKRAAETNSEDPTGDVPPKRQKQDDLGASITAGTLKDDRKSDANSRCDAGGNNESAAAGTLKDDHNFDDDDQADVESKGNIDEEGEQLEREGSEVARNSDDDRLEVDAEDDASDTGGAGDPVPTLCWSDLDGWEQTCYQAVLDLHSIYPEGIPYTIVEVWSGIWGLTRFVSNGLLERDGKRVRLTNIQLPGAPPPNPPANIEQLHQRLLFRIWTRRSLKAILKSPKKLEQYWSVLADGKVHALNELPFATASSSAGFSQFLSVLKLWDLLRNTEPGYVQLEDFLFPSFDAVNE